MMKMQPKLGLFVGIFILQVTLTLGKLRCLNCEDVLEPRLCHYIRHCQEGQACFTEQYETMDNQILYRLGCKSQMTCTKHNTTSDHRGTRNGERMTVTLCTDCCSSDLCNAVGCGAQGYPSLFGPVCYNCPQSRDVETCDKISVCKADESCFIQEESEFGSSFFATRCLQNDLCNIKSPNIIGKRSNGRKREIDCLHCCNGNLCNNICNQDGVTTNTMIMATQTVPTTTTVISTSTTTSSQTCIDSRGTEFVLMFIPNLGHTYENIELIFTSYSGQSSVMLTSTVTGVSRNVTLSNHAVHVIVSRDIVHVNSNVIQNKGLYIKSTDPISVHGYSIYHPECCTSSAFTALPVDMLGTDYIAISYHPDYDSQIGVVAVEDSSIITVTINTTQSGSVSFNGHTYVNGDTISLTLNRLNTIRIASTADLSGTKIHSNKPVGVISGNDCASFNGDCDNMASMLPPTNRWGLNFIIPRIHPANTMNIRIVPSVDMTTIEVHNNKVQNTYTSNKTVEITLSSEQLTFVYCNHPCLVVQFSADLNRYFNTFMAIVPSTNQFLNQYVLDTPTVKQFSNYASVIAKTSDVSGLRYNGKPISNATISASDKYTVDWTSINFQIKNGTNIIKHLSRNVNFSFTQYGFGPTAEAYGYPVAYSYGCSIN